MRKWSFILKFDKLVQIIKQSGEVWSVKLFTCLSWLWVHVHVNITWWWNTDTIVQLHQLNSCCRQSVTQTHVRSDFGDADHEMCCFLWLLLQTENKVCLSVQVIQRDDQTPASCSDPVNREMNNQVSHVVRIKPAQVWFYLSVLLNIV